MKVLNGFLIRDITHLADVELLLFEMKQYVNARANICFKKLVEWQVEKIVDEIVLGQFKRPEGECILDIAVNEVKRRMLYAEKTMQETEFNLYYGIQLLSGKIDGKPVVYLKVLSPNDVYSRNLKRIKELEPYDITEDDLKNKKGEKSVFYESMVHKYDSDIPLACCLIDYNSLSFKYEDLKFRKPEERAKDLAKEKMLNRLVGNYACDQEIPPNKLMEYVVFAEKRLSNPVIQEELEYEEKHLVTFLPYINVSMILDNGIIDKGDPVKDQNDDHVSEICEESDTRNDNTSKEEKAES